MEEPTVVVTLVHGTFARKARWIRSQSPLSLALVREGFQVVPFRWSGKNAHWARAVASGQLADHMEKQIANYGDAAQCIVAHSHGGNVAVQAVHGLARKDYSKPIFIITLSTPFIHVRQRQPPFEFLSMAGTFGGFTILAFGMVALIGDKSGWYLGWIIPILAVNCVIQLVLLLAGIRRHGNPKRPEVRSAWVDATHSPKVGPDDLLAIRGTGDEASGFLIGGQFVAWATTRLTQWIFNGRLLVSLFIGGFGLLFITWFFRLATAFISLLLAGLVAFVSAGLLSLTFASMLLVISRVCYGADGPMTSIFAFTTAESTPPGEARLIQLQLFPDGEKQSLTHSKLYNEDYVIRLVVARIKALSIR